MPAASKAFERLALEVARYNAAMQSFARYAPIYVREEVAELKTDSLVARIGLHPQISTRLQSKLI